MPLLPSSMPWLRVRAGLRRLAEQSSIWEVWDLGGFWVGFRVQGLGRPLQSHKIGAYIISGFMPM